MTDTSQGDGWWKASDEKWYAPDSDLHVAENWTQGPSGEWVAPPESRASVAPGWWQATDGSWHPSTAHPQPPVPLPPAILHDFDDETGPVPAHQHPNGGGWVANTATVSEEAFVGADASVFGRATVAGRASITGSARVCGNASVSGDAKVSGDAVVDKDARVTDSAEVTDDALVSGTSHVGGTAKISGSTHLGAEPEADTQIDREGVEWWWDGQNWNCWVAKQWVPAPGVAPEGLAPAIETAVTPEHAEAPSQRMGGSSAWKTAFTPPNSGAGAAEGAVTGQATATTINPVSINRIQERVMSIASREQKQQIVESMKNTSKKYQKPFEQGKMATVSIMGGNWEEYAAVVLDMVAADTLLSIDRQLEQMNATMAQVLIALQK